jgi:hypothetical protein
VFCHGNRNLYCTSHSLCGCPTCSEQLLGMCDFSLFGDAMYAASSRDLRRSLSLMCRSLSWRHRCGHFLAEIDSASTMFDLVASQSRKHRQPGAGLPEDVLRRVFTAVRNGEAGVKNTLSLMVVYRRFAVSKFTHLMSKSMLMVVQTLAEDVLLCSVAITSLEQLQSFELRLRKPTLPYRSTIVQSGCMVRSLEIAGFVNKLSHAPWEVSADKLAELVDWTASVTSVTALLPLLQHFALRQFHASRGHIACLRSVTQGQLTSLDISLCFDYNLSSGVMISINSLECLKHLKLTLPNTGLNGSASFPSSEAALIISSVITFDFRGPEIPPESCYAWISQCRFNVSCALLLDLRQTWDEEDIALLFTFFDAHHFRSVTLHTDDKVLEALASRLAQVNCLHLPDEGSAYALLSFAGRMPKHLIVNACNHGMQISEDFWEFLQLIPSHLIRGRTTTTLCVTISGDNHTSRPFLWSDGATANYAAFIGRLLTEAVRLYKEGVIIEDGDGRDIKHIID